MVHTLGLRPAGADPSPLLPITATSIDSTPMGWWRPSSRWRACSMRGPRSLPAAVSRSGCGLRCVSWSSASEISPATAAARRGASPSHRWSTSSSRCVARRGVSGASTTPIGSAPSWLNVVSKYRTPRQGPPGPWHTREMAESEGAHDDRERIANERDRVADARDDIADQREAATDARDIQLDDKERQLANRELPLDERARALREAVPDMVRRQQEAIDRSRGVLQRAEERLVRAEASLQRSRA